MFIKKMVKSEDNFLGLFVDREQKTTRFRFEENRRDQ